MYVDFDWDCTDQSLNVEDCMISLDRHPFSITSAPGDDYLSIHIRTRGDWTSQLRAIFSQVGEVAAVTEYAALLSLTLLSECNRCANLQRAIRADSSELMSCLEETTPGTVNPYVSAETRTVSVVSPCVVLLRIRLPKLLIDGPYGAPAQDYEHYDVLLLIGLGIGATPLISIVKDVLNNVEQKKTTAAADVESATKAKKKPFMAQRAYFYWVTREEGSFEWFRGIMNEVAEKDKDGVIELHNHCTSVYEEGDARSALIVMLQALHHAKNGVDIVSGTRVKTHFARPNWRNVFKRIAINHPNQRVGKPPDISIESLLIILLGNNLTFDRVTIQESFTAETRW